MQYLDLLDFKIRLSSGEATPYQSYLNNTMSHMYRASKEHEQLHITHTHTHTHTHTMVAIDQQRS